jgi:hypothetical protein
VYEIEWRSWEALWSQVDATLKRDGRWMDGRSGPSADEGEGEMSDERAIQCLDRVKERPLE